jgi:hypothetical protein
MGFENFFLNLFKGMKGSPSTGGFAEEDRTAGRSVSGFERPAPSPLPLENPATEPSPYDLGIDDYLTREQAHDPFAPMMDLEASVTTMPMAAAKPVFSPWKMANSGSPWWQEASFDAEGNLPSPPDSTEGMHKDNWRFWSKSIPGSPVKDRDFFDPILDRFALVESRADPKANIKDPSKAGGMYQFIPSTAKALGLKPEDRYDPTKSRNAARRLLEKTTTSMAKMIKRAPKPHEIYLGHQQGAGGAAALINRPEMNAVQALVKGAKLSPKQARRHILQNHGTLDMTSSEFIELMGGIFYDGWYMKDEFHNKRKKSLAGDEV